VATLPESSPGYNTDVYGAPVLLEALCPFLFMIQQWQLITTSVGFISFFKDAQKHAVNLPQIFKPNHTPK
jgi:hypothetical protein